MTDEDWRWFQLSLEARKLSASAIKSLEKQLQLDQSNMDVRVQLLSYYSQYEGNKLKHENAELKLFEQILWLIETKPSVRGHFGQRLMTSGRFFKPKTFAILRQAWLEQVSAAPSEGTILGNAA
jgi:hypothetical protein